jgi:hypothetical protein
VHRIKYQVALQGQVETGVAFVITITMNLKSYQKSQKKKKTNQ